MLGLILLNGCTTLASKLLAPLFDPLTLVILLAVCSLIAWKRRRLAIF
jgi:hypothetical protein